MTTNNATPGTSFVSTRWKPQVPERDPSRTPTTVIAPNGVGGCEVLSDQGDQDS